MKDNIITSKVSCLRFLINYCSADRSLFPRKSTWNRIGESFKIWTPSVYGHIPQIFYAILEKPPGRLDIWNTESEQKENGERIVGPKGYLYFVINASVGVGAKGRNNIKSVHIRFRLISMRNDVSEPEVVHMYPHTMSQLAGTRQVTEQIEKLGEAGVTGNVKVPTTGFLFKIFGGFGYRKDLQERMNYILPYHVVTANASGTGNRAIWEFYQEKGMAAIGQFDLKIFFRIHESELPKDWKNEDLLRDYYCVDWNVEINGKRLIDHSIDFNGKWNVKVNGRHLMDSEGKIQFEKKSNKTLDLKCHERWNVPLPYDSILEGDTEAKLSEDQLMERKRYKQMIERMMNEENPDTEPLKLLRPLYLVSKPKKE